MAEPTNPTPESECEPIDGEEVEPSPANVSSPLLYHELAPWWPLLSPPENYRDQAMTFATLLGEASAGPTKTLLELGAGGGHTASHLTADLQCTLVDRSVEMLAQSRILNPTAEHVVGDMLSARLGRQFDGVLVQDAVMHLTSETALHAAMTTAFEHCRPGGAALIAPDDFAETFAPSHEAGGSDGPDGRGARYLAWSHDPDPTDATTNCDFAYLLRNPNGTTETRTERMTFGLFSIPVWLELLADVGFRPGLAPLHEDSTRARAGSVLIARKENV